MNRWLVAIMGLASACSSPQKRGPAAQAPATPVVATGALAPGELDRLLDESWRAAKVTPAPPADDAEYLRRVTLDLVGRVPTLEEAQTFLGERGPDRRARLADRLLASPEFTRHFASVYADLLYGPEVRAKLERRYDPEGFLDRAFAENWRWDKVAYELITASGNSDDNGALAFIASRLKGGGGPEAVTGAVARIFLGLQIQCAQCHDHPYDPRWKQEDFYGLVAYLSQTRAKQEKSMDGSRTLVLTDVRRGNAKMRKPGSEEAVSVKPRFLGTELSPRPYETRRQALARGIVSSDLFAKVMVARTWSQLHGRGIVDPWDDLGAERDPKHPPLLTRLAEDFRAGGHDVRRLVRTIVLGASYARSSAGTPGAPDDKGAAVRAFARMPVRPLSSEQLFGTLVTATGVAEVGKRRVGEEAGERRLAQAFREYRFAFTDDDEMGAADGFDGSMPQALLLLNGELTNQATRAARGGTVERILTQHRDPEARLEALFLAIYTRRPTAEERRTLLEHVRAARGGREAWEDLAFALLTSTEAVTNH